jgi:hypothetical protein
MPVTELGFFRLKPDADITSQLLLHNLLVAKQTCEAFTARNSGNKGAVFRWQHCVEDAALIYYVGDWASVDEHRVQFVNSDDNKRLEGLLAGEVSIDQYFHLALDQSRVDVAPALDGEGVAVLRHFVKPGHRAEVDQLWQTKLPDLNTRFGGTGKVVGGWRIDRAAEDKDELVVFVGMETKDQRLEAGQTVLGGAEVMEYLDGVDVTHAAELHVGGESADLEADSPDEART